MPFPTGYPLGAPDQPEVQHSIIRGAATLTGTANVTGIAAGTNVPFTFVVRQGGPGATSVLTVNSSSVAVFNEILIEGRFEGPSGGS